NYREKTCGELEKMLLSRQAEQENEYGDGIRSGTIKPDPIQLKKQIELRKFLKELIARVKVKARCYNPIAMGEIMCKVAITITEIVGGSGAGMLTAKALASLVARGVISQTFADTLTLAISSGKTSGSKAARVATSNATETMSARAVKLISPTAI